MLTTDIEDGPMRSVLKAFFESPNLHRSFDLT